MFGSGQVFLSLSFYAILPVLIIFYYVYKRNKFPEPPRIVLVTFLLGIGTTFPLGILIIGIDNVKSSDMGWFKRHTANSSHPTVVVTEGSSGTVNFKRTCGIKTIEQTISLGEEHSETLPNGEIAQVIEA